MLQCSCSVYGDYPGSWWFYPPDDFSIFTERRRKRCCSCKELIDIGAVCIEFPRIRSPYTDIEESISGDEIDISPWYHCEACGEHYLNLEAAGYCLNLADDMRECLKEYHEITGFQRIGG